MIQQQTHWFDEPQQRTKWLVQGLITTDDNCSFVGKPKSGKSTAIRNLVASIVLGRQFLGRDVLLPDRTGRVLYIHVDRKDRKHQVASDLRNLGITREDSSRVHLLTEQDISKELDFEGRLAGQEGQTFESSSHRHRPSTSVRQNQEGRQ